MLAFLGGTGPEGRGLALRFALAGRDVIIGSRDPERAAQAALELRAAAPGAVIRGEENRAAARLAGTAFITVPYEAQRPLLLSLAGELAGKPVINVVAPLVFEKGRVRAAHVEEGSAARQSQLLLPRSRVAAAFQNLSASKLLDVQRPMKGDVVVCSDHREAKDETLALVDLIKDLRGIDGGGLDNARCVEQFTALLITVNRIYKAETSFRLVGL